MKKSLDEWTLICQSRLNNLFNLYLKEPLVAAPTLQEAMYYALTNGGKRIRPLLVYLIGEEVGTPVEQLDAPAFAIELIHTFSLIHDDLPAMDNADLRRGHPTCHKKFNEATAILAGDGLLALAFEVLAIHPSTLSNEKRLQMIQILAKATGLNGMTGGQALDMEPIPSLEALTKMYSLKTGALLTASVKLGLLATHITEPTIMQNLEKYIQALSLAFQIQDDLLDTEPDEVTGKKSAIDIINQKKTYPFWTGKKEAKAMIYLLYQEALQAIDAIGEPFSLLRTLTDQMLYRSK